MRASPPLVSGSFRQSRSDRAISFTFCHCTVKLTQKVLLDNVSGAVRGGRSLAILGPSGAGKTTLLNLLALERGVGRVSGRLLLNGHILSFPLFRRYCAYVRQHDNLWAFLTCAEHLQYAVRLFQPTRSRNEQQDMVDELCQGMGLGSCRNTRAGNQYFRGLSGGQRRRLSLAVALSKDPLLILLDEPTSGLDAHAASSIMSFLQEIARTWNVAMVFTIHQPSFTVFSTFDDCLFLTAGHVAYRGSGENLTPYLSSVGFPVPLSCNPAEFILDLINTDFEMLSPANLRNLSALACPRSELADCLATRLTAAWRDHELPIVEAITPAPLPGALRRPLSLQVAFLFRRHSLLVMRDPTLYLARASFFMLAGIFFATVYIKIRERTQQQVLNRVFFLMWLGAVPSLLGAVTVFSLNTELRVILAEGREGISVAAYIVASSVLQLPFVCFLSMCAVFIPGYFVCDLNVSAVGEMFLLHATFLWCFEAIAQSFSFVTNVLLGLLGYLTVWFVAFLMNGLLINETDVYWPFRLCAFISPYRWAMKSMLFIEFHTSKPFHGALPCNRSREEFVAPMCLARGFECPGEPSGLACYGQAGDEILASLKVVYPSVSEVRTLERDLLNIVEIGMAFKLCFIAVLLVWSRQASRQPASVTEALAVTLHVGL
mmetsp:Transcript_42639/g.70919  ORF Transcript_42639/g.70919 Transcript_42639/m.70919 type:complete len:659 (-) Transcript_42639:137-2113(-)